MDTNGDLGASIETLRKTVESLVTPRHVSGTYPLDIDKVGLFYRNGGGSKTG
jgi:hypothetical protein